MDTISINFSSKFSGILKNSRNNSAVEIGSSGQKPYEMAMAGMVSCFYSTFMDIAVKKRLEWESVDVDFSWEKLDAPVAYLKEANINMTVKIIKGKAEHFDKAFELAAKYCSLYQTFSKVADLSWKAEYENV